MVIANFTQPLEVRFASPKLPLSRGRGEEKVILSNADTPTHEKWRKQNASFRFFALRDCNVHAFGWVCGLPFRSPALRRLVDADV